VMSSHALYPALDPERIASQSKPILTDLLRGELGFEGVVVTDSMEAQASLESGGTYEATVERAMEAGNDLILTTGRGSSIRVYRALVKRAKADRAFAQRLREAAGRVRALTETLRRSR
jgi:beta-N-acetylhexosaminidase